MSTTNTHTDAINDEAERLLAQAGPANDGDDDDTFDDPESIAGGDFEDDDPFSDAGLGLERDRPTHLLGALSTSDAPMWFPLQGEDGRDLDGPQILVARAGNDDYQELITKAARKWGDKRGRMTHGRTQWALPIMYSKSLFLGIKGFRLGPEGEAPIDSHTTEVWIEKRAPGSKTGKPTRVEQTVKFDLDEDGWIEDTEDNRKRLLMVFKGLADQVWQRANDEAWGTRGTAGGVDPGN